MNSFSVNPIFSLPSITNQTISGIGLQYRIPAFFFTSTLEINFFPPSSQVLFFIPGLA